MGGGSKREGVGGERERGRGMEKEGERWRQDEMKRKESGRVDGGGRGRRGRG